ncbi:MAG: glycosyltransferase [Roseburia sp.]|nr:glycosyltransferase [Roseburia sp.]
MKPVSVIVVAYRSADTIVKTLESIKAQTYENIELIVSDDCSPDDTVAVARRWMDENKEAFQSCRLVTAWENTGIPGNINRALAYANGVYTKLLAADDYMTPDAIAEYVRFCEANPEVMPIARVYLFSEEDADCSAVQAYCDRCYALAGKDYREQYRMLLKQNWIVAPAASFYPIEILKRLGGYDERYRWFEDYPMNLTLMHGRYRFGLIDKELIYYGISGQSITGSQQLRLRKTEMKFFFRKRMWYMIQAGMGWEAVKQMKSWLRVLLQKE